MAQTVTVGGRLKFTVEGRLGGRLARFSGVPAWTVDPPLLQLVPGKDGLACVAAALAPGDCTVTASVPGLDGTFAVSVLPAEATALVIAAEVLA